MDEPAIKDTLKEMIRVILEDRPGQVPLGNVLMKWDGHSLSWDIPLKEWDVDGIWNSLRRQAEYHPEVDEIAFCAEALETM